MRGEKAEQARKIRTNQSLEKTDLDQHAEACLHREIRKILRPVKDLKQVKNAKMACCYVSQRRHMLRAPLISEHFF